MIGNGSLLTGAGTGMTSLSSFSESLPPELNKETSVSTSPGLLEALRGLPLEGVKLIGLATLALSILSFELSSSHS